MSKIQNIDKKFPATTRVCWAILKFKLQNSGEQDVKNAYPKKGKSKTDWDNRQKRRALQENYVNNP